MLDKDNIAANNNTEEINVNTLWKLYAPYWHVCMAILTALAFGVLWYGNVNNAMAQTAQNTADIKTLQTNLAGMSQEIHDMHDWLKAMRHK